MWQQHKKKLILLIIAGLLLLASGIYTGFKLGASGRGASSMPDPNAVPIDEAYLASQHYNPSTAVQGSFIHHLFTDLYFTVGSTMQELPVWNDPENPYHLMVTLYLDGEEEPLVASGLIPPGQMLSSVTLTHVLAAGDYTVMLVNMPADDQGNVYGSLSAKVVIHVTEDR